MPIEIRELIIEGSLARVEDRGEGAVKILTEEDIKEIKREITESVAAEGGMTSEQKRQLKEELLREVRKLLDDKWRR